MVGERKGEHSRIIRSEKKVGKGVMIEDILVRTISGLFAVIFIFSFHSLV